ncbi:MAG: 3-oxoacyl-ACP reductase FabG [Arcicella sp.]|jgi:NAD(P)-dependent dehydrogenase (short-subunit alcohol dehydrogenase family)|nr:3-oxoacyl-ACP reductase FabG [Arcicella sp.]
MENKVVLVTGGSRGIGRSICETLAERGCTVIFTYLSNEEKAQALAAEIREKGQKAFAYYCDMSDLKSVVAFSAKIRKEYGNFDALVNNAGILGDGKPFLMSADDHWWNVMKTNIGSVTNTCRAVVPQMIAQKKGRIVNITSVSGQKGNPGQSAYSASKSAIVTFSKALAKEVGRFGVVVNCVSPGLIETDMTKNISNEYVSARSQFSALTRKGEVQEVASLVSYLICDAPEYIVAQELTIDGGLV